MNQWSSVFYFYKNKYKLNKKSHRRGMNTKYVLANFLTILPNLTSLRTILTIPTLILTILTILMTILTIQTILSILVKILTILVTVLALSITILNIDCDDYHYPPDNHSDQSGDYPDNPFFFIEPEKTWFDQLFTFTKIVRLSIYITKQ